MPTYYNGKEITSTSKLSGLSLIGRDSVNIGGKVTTLSTPPPPPREMRVYGDPGSGGTAGYSNPGSACATGPGGYQINVFIGTDGGFSLYLDKELRSPLGSGFWWSDDTTDIGGGFDPAGAAISVNIGSVGATFRCGR